MVSLKTRRPLEAQAKAKQLTKTLEADWEKMLKGEQESLKEAQELLNAYKQAITSDGLDEDLGLGVFLDRLMDKQSTALLDEYNGSYAALDDAEANLTPTERKALQVLDGVISLSDAVDYYIETKGKSEHRKYVLQVHKALTFFTDELGDRPLNQYKRREVEDRLLKGIHEDGLKTATVARRLSDIKAAVNKAILNFEYPFKNPFEKHTIPNLREDEESRTSLTERQQEELLGLFSKGENSDTINGLRMIFDTGMRVSECVGLRTEDVILDGDIPHIRLHRHTFRRLKTKHSQRLIPLIGYALEGVKNQLSISKDTEWLFPRYVDTEKQRIKNDSASAAMNKRIKHLDITCHYLRHNLKDRLRLAGVSQDDINKIQGWSRPSQADRYGNMSLLEYEYGLMKRIEIQRNDN